MITTIGRPTELARFLDALDLSTVVDDVEVILVDQSSDRASTAVFLDRPARYQRRVTTSGRGAGIGRRVGLALATAELVGIPNDNCWYEPDLLADVISRLAADSGLAGVSGRQLTPDGRECALRWAKRATTVTRANFDRTENASTLFLRRAPTLAAGSVSGFIGTGSPGPFQSGEESDLVLRMLAQGDRVYYDPAIAVFKQEPRDLPDRTWVHKMLVYGRGQGYLWRVHRLSVLQMGYRILLKLGAAALHAVTGRIVLARADLAFAVGWLDGFSRARSSYPALPERPRLEAAQHDEPRGEPA